jgi:hypothetical protein
MGTHVFDFWWDPSLQLTEINREKCSKVHTNFNKHDAAYSTPSGGVALLLFKA